MWFDTALFAVLERVNLIKLVWDDRISLEPILTNELGLNRFTETSSKEFHKHNYFNIFNFVSVSFINVI